MARLALPSSTFSDVQRFLRHKRATGQTVSSREERSAWAGYWDAMAARQMSSRRLGLEERRLGLEGKRLDEYTRLAEERMDREEEAAKVSGVMELGTTAALGTYALKGTEIGAKLGLGTGVAKPGGGTKAVAPMTATTTAAPAVEGGAALLTATEGVGPTATEMGGAAFEEFAVAAPAAERGAMSAIAPLAGPAAVGYAAGSLSKMIPLGSGKTTGRVKGAVAGAVAGSYWGPAGTVIGAITGFFGGGK